MGSFAVTAAPAERLRGYGVRSVYGSVLRLLLHALFVNGGVLYREVLILFFCSTHLHQDESYYALGISADKPLCALYVGLEYEIWCSESVVPAVHQG